MNAKEREYNIPRDRTYCQLNCLSTSWCSLLLFNFSVNVSHRKIISITYILSPDDWVRQDGQNSERGCSDPGSPDGRMREKRTRISINTAHFRSPINTIIMLRFDSGFPLFDLLPRSSSVFLSCLIAFLDGPHPSVESLSPGQISVEIGEKGDTLQHALPSIVTSPTLTSEEE